MATATECGTEKGSWWCRRTFGGPIYLVYGGLGLGDQRLLDGRSGFSDFGGRVVGLVEVGWVFDGAAVAGVSRSIRHVPARVETLQHRRTARTRRRLQRSLNLPLHHQPHKTLMVGQQLHRIVVVGVRNVHSVDGEDAVSDQDFPILVGHSVLGYFRDVDSLGAAIFHRSHAGNNPNSPLVILGLLFPLPVGSVGQNAVQAPARAGGHDRRRR